MTFKEFQKTRKLCTDEDAHDWEGDLRERHAPRFHYTLPSKYGDDGVIHIGIDICDGYFDIGTQGYPNLDCFVSLEQAERTLWNFALSEDWGVEGKPVELMKELLP